MAKFLVTHGILDEPDRRPLVRFCWCSDGPWDICNFVIKQCFISKVNWILIAFTPVPTSRKMKVPPWISNQFIDVRALLCGRDRKKHASLISHSYRSTRLTVAVYKAYDEHRQTTASTTTGTVHRAAP